MDGLIGIVRAKLGVGFDGGKVPNDLFIVLSDRRMVVPCAHQVSPIVAILYIEDACSEVQHPATGSDMWTLDELRSSPRRSKIS